MKLKTFDVLKLMYWGFRRNRRNLLHLFHVLIRFIHTYILFLIWKHRHARRPVVVIAQIEFMGDILAAEPISRFARQQFPDAHIVWVARKPFRDMIACFTAVDHVVTVGCLTEWMLLMSTGLCDTVWDLHLSGHHCAKCQAPLHKTGSASGIGYETYLDFGNLLAINCLCAGIEPISDAPILAPGRDALAAVDALDLPQDFVVVHCLSNDCQKHWSPTKWMLIATYITETLNRTIVEVGLEPVIVTANTEKRLNLCGRLSILETADVIRRAALFVGVDSGPAHLANATGTSGVILLGKFGRWETYMPYSGAYQTGIGADLVRTSGPLRDLPIEAVVQAITKRLNEPGIGRH